MNAKLSDEKIKHIYFSEFKAISIIAAFMSVILILLRLAIDTLMGHLAGTGLDLSSTDNGLTYIAPMLIGSLVIVTFLDFTTRKYTKRSPYQKSILKIEHLFIDVLQEEWIGSEKRHNAVKQVMSKPELHPLLASLLNDEDIKTFIAKLMIIKNTNGQDIFSRLQENDNDEYKTFMRTYHKIDEKCQKWLDEKEEWDQFVPKKEEEILSNVLSKNLEELKSLDMTKETVFKPKEDVDE